MTEAEQAKLFQPFVQGDVSTTRRFGGTGLGLTISRKFAQMLGGDIAVRSSPGAGTSVTVTVAVGPVLPASLVHNLTEASTNYHVEEPAVDGCESLAGARILLAEDGLDNREILTAYLRGAGANVETVEDGRQAVQQVLAALADGRTYTIVVMDMQMPVLDGYGATSELRRRGYRGAIVALTANAMAEDRARCLLAGCDDYLTKPVNRRALTAAVAQHIRGTDNTPSSVTLEQRRDLAHASAVGSAATGAHASRTIISEIAGDPKLASVLAGFVSRLPDVVVELRQLIDAEALVGVTRLAHKLRGAGGSYGFAELSAAAARVEDQLVAGGSLADAQPDVDYLIEVLRCVSGYDHSAESVPKLAS
jgi:CheY-like chemotaxis protein/HPt (histidine-containing phosphotransfer) domain-containing protein